jgi:hypothetical protein
MKGDSMITIATKTDVLNLTGRILTGIFSNPSNSVISLDQGQRQALIHQTLRDVRNALLSSDIDIVDDEPCSFRQSEK